MRKTNTRRSRRLPAPTKPAARLVEPVALAVMPSQQQPEQQPVDGERKLLISLCDYSGRWSQPYVDAGWEVIRVDIKTGGDARKFKKINRKVHGILCAPVCTEFSSAGARWWKGKEEKGDQGLLDGLALVDACLRIVAVHDPDFWVMENPVGRLKDWIGQADYGFHPSEFAGWLETQEEQAEEAYTKKTMLWGKFNEPEKRPVDPVLGSKMWSQYGGKSEATKTARSMTPRGFSAAFFDANH